MIITLTEYKTFPSYSATQSDAMIETMIDSVEEDFLNIRGKDFKSFTGDITIGSLIISDISNITGIKIGDVVSSFNASGKVTAIGNGTVTIDTVATGSSVESTYTVYPRGSKRIASEMLNFKLETYTGIGVESIGDHSVDYGEMTNGYPKSIVNSIKRFLWI